MLSIIKSQYRKDKNVIEKFHVDYDDNKSVIKSLAQHDSVVLSLVLAAIE